MDFAPRYVEETFGILTDDDVYLDCVLIKPVNLADENLQALRVWVPKHPLTKATIITCARQEVSSYGPDGTIAHLAFDLRGTGESEGSPRDRNFRMDLLGIKAWAEERFGKINLGFLGTPDSKVGRVNLTPIRPGVTIENYYYPANEQAAAGTKPRSPIIYFASYSNFNPIDDALCIALSQAGYNVYGLDPLRYLLHAGSRERLNTKILWHDWRAFCRIIGNQPTLIGQPISAGLCILLASNIDEVSGVISIGRTDVAFKPWYIFDQEQRYSFLLARHVFNIAPRPVAFVLNERRTRPGEEDEINTLFQTAVEPRYIVKVKEVSPDVLLKLLAWLQDPDTTPAI